MSASPAAMPACTPTLDQLRVLVAVVEHGSFSAAGRALNRTQSVISYTVAALETQLGLSLFERGGRRPALTEAGHAVLADARRVNRLLDEMRARADGLNRGLEAELAIVVDVMFPTAQLVRILDDFARAFPTVSLRLRVEALGAVTQLVLDRACALGVSGWMSTRFEALERRQLGAIRLQAVAAPTHPLASATAALLSSSLAEHVQLVLTDRSQLTAGEDFGVLSLRTWRLGDLGAKHALLLAGLGWGNMPEPMVRDELAAGRLVRLDLAEGQTHEFPLMLIHRTDAPPGPAGAWIAERFLSGD